MIAERRLSARRLARDVVCEGLRLQPKNPLADLAHIPEGALVASSRIGDKVQRQFGDDRRRDPVADRD